MEFPSGSTIVVGDRRMSDIQGLFIFILLRQQMKAASAFAALRESELNISLAVSDVLLQYRLLSGSLPPDLELLSNGEITGIIADQPTAQMLDANTTTNFSFTIVVVVAITYYY